MKMTQQSLDKFYSKVSFAGMLILYTFKLSFEKNTAFDRDELSKASSVIRSDYFLGFIVACTSFEIIEYNTNGKVITVTYIDPMIIQTIEAKAKELSESSENWPSWLESISDFFNKG